MVRHDVLAERAEGQINKHAEDGGGCGVCERLGGLVKAALTDAKGEANSKKGKGKERACRAEGLVEGLK